MALVIFIVNAALILLGPALLMSGAADSSDLLGGLFINLWIYTLYSGITVLIAIVVGFIEYRNREKR